MVPLLSHECGYDKNRRSYLMKYLLQSQTVLILSEYTYLEYLQWINFGLFFLDYAIAFY